MEKNKLTPAEIERVQAMYLGCDSWCTVTDKSVIVKSTAKMIDRFGYRTDWWLLLLTPLSALSGQHQADIRNLNLWESFNQLILYGYAVPLWFGIGHWANGLTAIELGIAIDKQQTT
jgi:hypothetical protein